MDIKKDKLYYVKEDNARPFEGVIKIIEVIEKYEFYEYQTKIIKIIQDGEYAIGDNVPFYKEEFIKEITEEEYPEYFI